MDTTNAVAVITGASTGIGRELAKLMASRGTRLVLAARRVDRLEQVVTEIKASGGDVVGVPTDISDLDQVQALADAAWKAFGRVDLAVFNAGVPAGDNMLDSDLAAWKSAIDTNLYGLLHCFKAFVPRMHKQGTPAAIYTTGSGAGANGTNYRAAPYSVTKNAQLSIMECLYGQLRDAKSSLRAGIILPPMTRTNLVGDDLSAWNMIEKSLHGTHVIEPEDFAHVILDGIEEERFWVEATEEDNKRHLGGRNAGAIKHSHKMIAAKAAAMIDHTAPDPYLW